MIANLAVAMILAAGLGLLVTGLRRPRVDLEASVGRWDARRRDAAAARLTSGRSSGAAGRFARWLRAALNERGIDFTRSASDLALLDRTIEQHLTSKLLAAAAGAAAPALMVGAFRLAGIGAPLLLGGAVSLLLTGLFFFVPDLELRSKATRRRAEMRRALGCYLDLVAMALAGGRGVPEALPQAAQVGRGWAFDLLTDTVSHATYAGQPPWAALGALGARVDLPELRDLGGALTLVADDGARVKESLIARANTQRKRQLAEAEGDAEARSKKLNYGLFIFAAGFLLFLIYPAAAKILAI